MVNKFLKNIAAGVESIYGFACDPLEAIIEPIADDEVDMPEESIPDPTVHISQGVLDNFRKNVGRYAPETGGLLGATNDRLVWTSATSIVIPRILRVRSITMSPP